MRRKISSSKKILIAILSLSVFVIAGIVSLVLVLANNQQNVSSNINVAYISNNVSAQVVGKYWLLGDNSKTSMGTITFNANDSQRTGTMSPSSTINLTTEKRRVVFEYAFKNVSTTTAFTVELTNSPRLAEIAVDYNNMTQQYYVSAVEVSVASINSMTLSNTLNIQPVMKQRVGQNDTVYIYIVASVANLANNANYNGTYEWELNYVNTTTNPIVSIQLDNNGGLVAPATMEVVTGTYGALNQTINMPCLFTLPTKSEKGFMGYYTATSEGTQYVSHSGSPVHNNKTLVPADMTSSTTLYAQWSDYEISAQGVLTGYSGSSTTLNIPATTTSLAANVFQNNTTIEEVNLPTTITEVGDNAFDGCTNLEEINFDVTSANGNKSYTGKSNLQRVGTYAFKDCTSLTSIEIPGTATLSANMFSGCTNLHNITAPIYSSYQNNYLSGLTSVNLVINGNGTSIGDGAFYGCTSLTSVSIPSSVTSIGVFAFSDCTSLTSVTIGSSVTSIGDSAFSDCSNLTSVTIPSSVTSIGERAFSGCTGLTSVTIGSSVTSIGTAAFNGCTSLTNITIPNSVTSIGDGAFYGCTSLTSVSIGSSVTSIGDSAFSYCTSLTSITVDANNSTYASQDGILYNKTKTTIVVVPQGITGSVTLSSTLTSIGDYAFDYCTGLTSITIPSSVTSIGEGSFSDCTSLTSVTIGSSVTSIGHAAFYGCSNLTGITVDANNANFASEGGIIYNKAKTEIVVVPEGITGSVALPNTLTSIGSYAFSDCTSLTSVSIGSSVTSIGYSAFQECTSLTSVTFEDTTSTWTISSSSNGGGTIYEAAWTPSTASANATALKTTYLSRYWTKNT